MQTNLDAASQHSPERGRRALRRLGYGLVQNFLKLAMKVAIADFNAAYLAQARAAFAGCDDVRCLQVDVGDRVQLRAAARELTAEWMDPVELGALPDDAFPSQVVPAGRARFEVGRRASVARLRALPVRN